MNNLASNMYPSYLPPPPPPPSLGVSADDVRKSFFTSKVDFTPLHQHHEVDSIRRPQHEPKTRRRPFIEPSDSARQCKMLDDEIDRASDSRVITNDLYDPDLPSYEG